MTFEIPQTWQKELAGIPPELSVLGNWSLNVHHSYDTDDRLLKLGTGGSRTANDISNVIATVAGNGTSGDSGDNGPATQAQLNQPYSVAFGPDGSLYIAEFSNHRIRKVSPDNIITTVAGIGIAGFSGDGGLAIQAQLNTPSGIALGSDGSLYIADFVNNRIRRVGPGSLSVKLPSGLTSTITTTSTAPLSDPNDLLSLTTLTDTTVVNGKVYTRTFNKAALTTVTMTPLGRTTTTQLNNKGRPAQTSVTGLHPVNYQYDSRGRLTQIGQGTIPNERINQVSYNAQGYPDSMTDAINRVTAFEYDLAGRVTRQTLPDNREINFTYDANGNLESITPPGRPPHVYSHTPVNLTQDYTPPTVGLGNPQTVYLYNKDKQLTRITRPDGQLLDYSYHPTSGKLTSLALPTGTYYYQYSPTTGKLNTLTAPDGGQLSYTYDGSLLKNTAWAGTVAGSVGRTYNTDFNLSELRVNGTNPIALQYDNDQLLTQAGSLTLTRNAQNGLLTGTTLGNVTDSTSYNGFAEVTQYSAKYATAEFYKTDYTRDKLGRITQKVETVGGSSHTYDYTYDTAGRLVEEKKDGLVQANYGYDANGNRTDLNGVLIAHYDNQDRLLDYNNATFEYTANGELKAKTTGATTTNYDYDVLGNLKKVTFANGNTLDYLTDGQNRRIGKKVNGVLVKGWLYQDGLRPIVELDGAGQIVSRFVYATGANSPDYMVRQGATYRIIKDHLGSPRLIIEVATNVVTQEMDYDVWGNVTHDSNPGFQPFGFAGGLYDPDTKLVRFGARDYDALTGRWTAKDPIQFEGGDTSLYAYVNGNPVNWVDPTGQFAQVLIPPVAAATVGYMLCQADPTCRAKMQAATKSCIDGVTKMFSESSDEVQNTNPYAGPVDESVIVVDENGNAIPVDEGQQIYGSPNGDYQQVIGVDGKPTGDRLDRGGHRGQSDPRAQQPHAHRPGVTTPDGNPHLPIY